ncbi:MAG: hypothetical protein P4L91_20950 [Burkholderiaceae bacterium]|nr:hypothetical protein [Burkholderiaceae bacterium]
MEKSKQAFRQGLKNGWRLFRSPFVGAWTEMSDFSSRPKAKNWKEFVMNDARAYFAPQTGAVRGFTRTLDEIRNKA